MYIPNTITEFEIVLPLFAPNGFFLVMIPIWIFIMHAQLYFMLQPAALEELIHAFIIFHLHLHRITTIFMLPFAYSSVLCQ